MTINELTERSYSPYSNEDRIAVVKSRSGAWFPGVRVENISFPLTISAVQNAVFCCLSEGHQPETLFTDKNDSRDRSTYDHLVKEYQLKEASLNVLDDISFESVLLPLDEKDIYDTLKSLLDNPHVRESNFPVAALLKTERGFISGINIEVSEWNRGLCAERVALAKAISYGITDIKAMHLTTLHGEYNSPCGACRQVIIEHLSHHPIYLHYADGSRSMHYSSDLLPYSFQSNKLQQHNH